MAIVTWNGKNADWLTNNWSGGQNPQPLGTDVATIKNGNVTVGSGDFILNAGALNMTGGTLTVQSGGSLSLTTANGGNGYIASVNISGGTFTVDGGALTFGSNLNAASGTVIIKNGGSFQWNGTSPNEVDGSTGSTSGFIVDLQSGTAQFTQGFDGSIKDFSGSDVIYLSGNVTKESYSNNVLSVSTSVGYNYSFKIIGSYQAYNFVASGSSIYYSATPVPPAAPKISGLTSATDTGTSQTDGVTQTYQSGGFIQVAGTGVVGDTITIYVDGNKVTENLQGSPVVDSNGNWVQGFFISQGTHSITATQADAYNPSTASSGYTVKIDETAPSISGITLNKSAYKLGDTVGVTIQLAGSYDNNGNYVLKSGSTIDGATLTNVAYHSNNNTITGQFVVGTGTTEVINGSVGTSAVVVDAAGNESAYYSTAIGSTTIDTHAPTQVNIAGFDNAPLVGTGTSSTAAYAMVGALSTVDASPGDSFTYQIGAGDPFTISNNTLYVGDTPLTNNVQYHIIVISTDRGGNNYAETFDITAKTPAPTVTAQNISVSGGTGTGGAFIIGDTVTAKTPAPTVTAQNISVSGGTGTGGAFIIGDTVTATWNNSASGDNNTDPLAGVTMNFMQFGGGSAVSASNVGGVWTATYTITVGSAETANAHVGVTATDTAFQSTTTSSGAFTVDDVAPTVTNEYAVPNYTAFNANNVITFAINTSEAVNATGSTLTLSNGQTAALSGGNGTSTLSYVYTIASGDTNTSDLKATALNGTIKDLAGNLLYDGGFTTIDTHDVVDTIAPATPATPTDAAVINGYVNAANDTAAQTLSGTAEVGSTVTIYDGLTKVATVTANTATGAWSYQIGFLADGSTHSYTVTATDAARNTSLPSGALAFTVDTTAPTITIDTPVAGDNVINKAEAAAGVTVTGTTLGAEDGQTVTIKLIDATNNVVATDTGTVSSGVWSATISAAQAQALADGSYTLAADVSDKAGNPATEATGSISVDETPPGAPSVALTHDTGSSATDNLTRDPSLTYTLSAQGDTLLYKVDGASAYTSTAPSFATDGTADGKHTISVEEVDPAGNIGPATTFTFTLDTIAPAAPTLTASSSATSASGAPTLLSLFTGGTTSGLSGKAEPGSTITFYDNGMVIGTTTTSANGTYSFASPKLVKGANRIQTTATDAAGNTSGLSNAVTLTNGSGLVAAPSTPVLTAASDTGRSASDRITSDTTPTFTGTAKTGTTVTLYDGNTVIGSMLIGATGKYSITTSALADGPHSVTAIATDVSGNMSYPSATTTLTIDTLAPATPTLTAGNTSQTRPLLTGTAEAGSTVTIYDNGAKLGTTTATTKGTYSYTTPTLSQNVHDLTVTATDAAGNVSNLSVELFVGSKPVQNLSHALFAAAFAPGAASTQVIPTVQELPPTIAADVLNLFVHHG